MHQGPFQFHTTMGASLVELAPTAPGTTPVIRQANQHNTNLSRSKIHGHRSYSVQAAAEQYNSSVNVADRKVHFAVTIKKHEILNLDDYTSQEKVSCWYTADEKAKITAKGRKTAARMDAGKPEKVRPYRGLEHWTEQGSNRFHQQVALVIDGVMDEQDNQWNTNCDNHDRIASICRALTAPCAQRARQIAREDHEIAMSIRQSMFDDTSSCMTDEDSVISFAHVVAKKRREQARQKNAGEAEESKSLRRRARRQRREKHKKKQSDQHQHQHQQSQLDPPGVKNVYGSGGHKHKSVSPTTDDGGLKHNPGDSTGTPSSDKKLRKLLNVRKQQFSAKTA